MHTEEYSGFLFDFENDKSDYEQPQGYWFTYTPQVFEDIPLLYYSNNDGDFNRNNFELTSGFYSPQIISQPSLHLAVFDDGIRYAVLHNSMKVKDIKKPCRW